MRECSWVCTLYPRLSGPRSAGLAGHLPGPDGILIHGLFHGHPVGDQIDNERHRNAHLAHAGLALTAVWVVSDAIKYRTGHSSSGIPLELCMLIVPEAAFCRRKKRSSELDGLAWQARSNGLRVRSQRWYGTSFQRDRVTKRFQRICGGCAGGYAVSTDAKHPRMHSVNG